LTFTDKVPRLISAASESDRVVSTISFSQIVIECHVYLCLQDVMGTVVGIELSAEQAWEFLWGLEATLGE